MLWGRISLNAHALIVGKTGAGKSKLLELMCYDLQRKTAKGNKAIVLVDVHGDLGRTVLSFSHNQKQRHRIVYISSAINREFPSDAVYAATLNPFDIGPDKSVEAVSIYANEMADALAECLETTAHPITVQMSALLRPAIFTVMLSDSPSLETLALMFLDKNDQNAKLLALGMQSPVPLYRQFFQHDWNSPEYALSKRSIRTKILYMIADPMLSHMLNGKSTVNLEQCLQDGKVIIINVPKAAGKFTSSMFSRLSIAFIHAIMLRRDRLDRRHRKPCVLMLDEFQNMITSSLVSSLAECRKFGLTVCLASQTTQVLDKQVRTATTTNCGIKMVSQLDHEGKLLFSKELQVPISSLNDLKPLQFMVRKSEGKGSSAFQFTVPMLQARHYLTKQQQSDLLQHIVTASGQYRKVLLPPAPPTAHVIPADSNPNNKRKGSDPFSDGLQPAF